MSEREVAVCSADEGQQARNSCPELHIFFSLGITWYFLHVISSLQGCVHGVLTMSTTSLMFRPNQSDPLVQEHGVEQYELLIPLNDITHASITRDVALPRR